MKIYVENREGKVWKFESEKDADLHLKKGWRRYAERDQDDPEIIWVRSIPKEFMD